MTCDDFRRLARVLPDAVESAHMGHPDFRIGGRVFATLHYPSEEWGMVKLTPEEQEDFVKMAPKAFVPVKGAWGRQGCTNVRLELAEVDTVDEALRLAWKVAKAKAAVPAPRKRKRG